MHYYNTNNCNVKINPNRESGKGFEGMLDAKKPLINVAASLKVAECSG
jgi:hypothetical protein